MIKAILDPKDFVDVPPRLYLTEIRKKLEAQGARLRNAVTPVTVACDVRDVEKMLEPPYSMMRDSAGVITILQPEQKT